jgi:signal transduction histidine kinase
MHADRLDDLELLSENARLANVAHRAGRPDVVRRALEEVDRLLPRVQARLGEGAPSARQPRAEFLATISHELRTPINLVFGYADMALDAADPAESRAHIGRIRLAAHHLLDLVEETLCVGQIDLGWSDVREESVHLASFWHAAREQCAWFPHSPEVILEWVELREDRILVTDPHKLGVVVRNLVDNALKFTAAGRVTVEADCDRDSARFAVSDTGVGIPTEAQMALFDPSRWPARSATERFGGLGFGLYIVRRFLDQLGGDIDVESQPGVGSTFVVRLPWRHNGGCAAAGPS